MFYFLVFLSTALFCVGMVFLLERPFRMTVVSSVKQIDIIVSSTLEESQKDKLLIRNLGSLLLSLFLTLLLLGILIGISILPIYVYLLIAWPYDPRDFSSVYFYLSMIGGSGVLLLFRKKNSDYSYWSKLLHTIILDNYNIGRYLFRREKKRHLKAPENLTEDFVIVTGLARGGTTALTRLLFDEHVFHSITYANMPFLMAPHLWRRIYKPRKGNEKERAHGDQVLVGKNSIEALEEYFFKVFLHDSYIGKEYLKIHEVDDDVYTEYLSYQQLFTSKETNTTYLAKNNNFILRYESLRKQNDRFRVILIFRDPADHAQSLLRQHENFVEQQTKDAFVTSYMNWLGHHEFGLNQKPFDLGGKVPEEKYPKHSPDFWLAEWINYYNYVLNLPGDPQLFLVHYDDLLHHPKELYGKLEHILHKDLPSKKIPKFETKRKHSDSSEMDPSLLSEARKIYAQLIEKKVSI